MSRDASAPQKFFEETEIVDTSAMNRSFPLDIIKLTALMGRTSGHPDVKIGLIDGPVMTGHPDLAGGHVLEISGQSRSACTEATSNACRHGTFIAGILAAQREAPAPAICPDCPLVIRPIFTEAARGRDQMPSTTPRELAAAILDCLHAGARVLNLSLALAQPSTTDEPALDEAFNQCVRRGVLVVAAAGNQGTLGSSAITRHPWVIPVVACDDMGRPLTDSNLGSSIGRRGLTAPGAGITSLGTEGHPLTLGGTSVAVPFVTGAIALLWSAFPAARAAHIKLAITHQAHSRRASVVPPLLDATAAYQALSTARAGR